MESFLEDAERTAAAEDDDKQDVDVEDRLGEGLNHAGMLHYHAVLLAAWLVTYLLHVVLHATEFVSF